MRDLLQQIRDLQHEIVQISQGSTKAILTDLDEHYRLVGLMEVKMGEMNVLSAKLHEARKAQE